MARELKRAKRRTWLLVALAMLIASGANGSVETVPVTPGRPGPSSFEASPCPSFTWASREQGAVELAVWSVADALEARVVPKTGDSTTGRPPRIRRRLPAGARVWTPGLEACMPPGAHYAWSVRPAGSSEWAPPLFFSVSSEVSVREVRKALEVFGLPIRDGMAPQGAGPETEGPTGTVRGRASEPYTEPAVGSRPGTFGGPQPGLPAAVADAVALFSESAAASGVTYGVHGVSDSSDTASAGLVGQSTATTGITYGVLGLTASPDGVAGTFENVGGGDAIRGISAGVEVFSVAADGTVTAVDFSGDGSQLFDAVSGLACASACVDSSEILDGSIVGSRLAADSVGHWAIADGVVSTLHIADGSVGSSELATNSVGEDEIADGAVGAAEIQANAVGSDQILSLQVETADLANDAVTRSKIKGTEVELYEIHDDCADAGDLTLSATCVSTQGTCPFPQFQNCSGACTAIPQFCDNSLEGYLLDPTLLN